MRAAPLVLLALLGVASPAATAAPVPKVLNKGPVLDGTWEVVELNANGQDVTKLNPWVWQVQGEQLVIFNRVNGELQKNDPKTQTTLVRGDGYGPGEVDYVRDDGTTKLTFKGVVSVADDVLTICFSDVGLNRPAESKAGRTVHYLRFKRIADK